MTLGAKSFVSVCFLSIASKNLDGLVEGIEATLAVSLSGHTFH